MILSLNIVTYVFDLVDVFYMLSKHQIINNKMVNKRKSSKIQKLSILLAVFLSFKIFGKGFADIIISSHLTIE